MLSKQETLIMSLETPFLLWADTGAQQHYKKAHLSAADVIRADVPRGPKAERDWQVSRALLHAGRIRVPAGCVESLSHSHGSAVVALAPKGWRVGVDIERVRPRRVLELAEWACSASEVRLLHGLSGDEQLLYFYLLWTMKEAFIKAAGLSFPVDLKHYGLDGMSRSLLSLRAPPGAWYAAAYRLQPEWVASVVWQPTVDAVTSQPQWIEGPASTLPSLTGLGIWNVRTTQKVE